MDKETLLKKGNESIAAGALWGVGLAFCPCPTCIIGTGGLILNGIKEKLGF